MLSQIPFQPDWLMEALGVVPIDPQHVTLRPEKNGQFVNLISERLSPSGQTVKKVITVDMRYGIVVSQSLHDMNGVLIARARLEKHFRDKATGIILPHLIALDWPQADLHINLEINQIEVNPTSIPPRNWQVPKKPYYPAFDIGALSRKNAQMADRVGSPRNRGIQSGPDGQGGRVDAASGALGDSTPGDGPPAQFGAPSPLARPGRAAAPPGISGGAWPEADTSEWNQPTQGPPGNSPGRAQLGSFDGGSPSTKTPATPQSRSANADNPFSDPLPSSSQAPARPASPSPPWGGSGANSGDPFESLPH